MAHSLAVESARVNADVIEVQEFPDMGREYGVKGVPLTVINGSVSFTGAADENMLMNHIIKALDGDSPPNKLKVLH